MPWTCPSCKTDVEQDSVTACPECDTNKHAWTLVADKTRTMVVAQKKSFSLRRGDDPDPHPQGDAANDSVTLSPAESIPVVPKSVAQWLHGSNHLPPSADVVFVNLTHNKAKDHTITLEVVYEGKPSDELGFKRDRQDDDPADVLVPFLFVYGDGPPLDGVVIPGVHVVDVSEEGGCASEVSFEALGRPAQELPTIPQREFLFSL